MIDWGLIWQLLAYVAFYAIGKGIGRAQGREQARPLQVILRINGDTVGGFAVTGGSIGEVFPERDHNDPTDPT